MIDKLDVIQQELENIGYSISEVKSAGIYESQIKFKNSNAIVKIYDSQKGKPNTVIGGKPENKSEEMFLKNFVDNVKYRNHRTHDLNRIIVDLINQGKETEYCDFKEKWYEKGKSARMVHDILCLANNISGDASYLIVGVADNGEIVGLESRDMYSDDQLNDALLKVEFCENSPSLKLEKLQYTYKEIQVLVIQSNTKNMPYYLNKDFDTIRAGTIYTRNGSINTPKNSVAPSDVVEKLWKIRFEQ